ncbi:GH13041 [Drosophila grimshawi]|uniref:GH13041 n=1 Tax=Drosophila grimshawi TaxID=7222 RepID=B4JR77_DROGR|nr:GH13041 [Drosophila grimshawi]
MPAVVRIKRRIDEEPHSAFVLNGKRRRLLNDENAPASTTTTTDNKEESSQVILKFAGTLEKQDDSATKKFAAARLNKESAKELLRQTNDPAIATAQRRDKQRQEAQQTAREQRYRVVNCLRTALHEDEEENGGENGAAAANAAGSSSNMSNSSCPQQPTEKKQITIVDIESQQTQQTAPQSPLEAHQQPADSDIGYVYDLYVPENETQADYVDMLDDNYLRFVLHIEEQQMFNITNFYM